MYPQLALAPYRRTLARRPFVALRLAQAASNAGDTLYDGALPWHILDRTGSPLAADGARLAATAAVAILADTPGWSSPGSADRGHGQRGGAGAASRPAAAPPQE